MSVSKVGNWELRPPNFDTILAIFCNKGNDAKRSKHLMENTWHVVDELTD